MESKTKMDVDTKIIVPKVCYFINCDWYFELHWLERAKSTINAGYEVHLICNFSSETIKNNLSHEGIVCHESGISSQSVNPLALFFSFFKIWNIVKTLRPTILHCITVKACLIGALISKLQKKPVIISFAGLGRIFTQNKISTKIIKAIIIKLFQFSLTNKNSHVTFEHDRDRQIFSKLCKNDPQRMSIISGAGVNTEFFSYSPEPENIRPIVLFAARMLWSKGLNDLIIAKEKLEKDNIFFDIHVAGIECPADPDSISHDQIMRWHNNRNIKWLGKCTDMHKAIQNCNIVALPSIYSEGIPRILLEAASTGRACLAYDVGGCNEIVIDNINGFLIEPRNIEKLKLNMRNMINNKKKRKIMGIKARKIAHEKFSSKIVINATLELYNSYR